MKFLSNEKEFKINKNAMVDIKIMGNIIEVRHMTNKNTTPKIKKVSKDSYINLENGEIMSFEKTQNRSQGENSIRITMRKLREYINTNVIDKNKCHWITLTYKQRDTKNEKAKPMRDTKKLYRDFKVFMIELRRDYPNNMIEYITVVEPQQNGSWHLHVILIWDIKRPFIDNKTFRERYWKNRGFVVIRGITKKCDNIGAYFSAYLADVEYKGQVLKKGQTIKEITDKHGKTKKFIKGARLHYYPSGMNIFRCSRGIKKPEKYTAFYKDLNKNMLGRLSYKNSVNLINDDLNKTMTIQYEYYNCTNVDWSQFDNENLINNDDIEEYYSPKFNEKQDIIKEISEQNEYKANRYANAIKNAKKIVKNEI